MLGMFWGPGPKEAARWAAPWVAFTLLLVLVAVLIWGVLCA